MTLDGSEYAPTRRPLNPAARVIVPCIALVFLSVAVPCEADWALQGNSIATGPGDQQYPEVISDGSGGAIVIWEVGLPGRLRLLAQRLTSQGAPAAGWPDSGKDMFGNEANANAPRWLAVPDGEGGAFVTRNAGHDDVTNTVLVRHLRADGNLSTIPMVYDAGGVGYGLSLAPRGPGQALLAWTHDEAGLSSPRLLALGMDGSPAPGWPPGGTPLDVRRSELVVDVVRDLSGGAYVMTFVHGGDLGSLYLHRADSTGTVPGWPDSGRLVGHGVSLGANLSIVPSGDGVIVTWGDVSSADSEIRVQRFDGDGEVAAGWPPTGIVLGVEGTRRRDPVATPDGTGGVVVVWHDFRTPDIHFSQLYGQRLLASGAIAWSPTGVPILTRDQGNWPTVTSDGVGGLFVTWTHVASDAPYEIDIRATRLLGDGRLAAGWPSEGLPVCNASGIQFHSRAVVTGGGNIMVAWTDARDLYDDRFDVYATQVSLSAGVVGGTAATLALRPPTPNPSDGRATIVFDTSVATRARVEIFDLSGRIVRTLMDGEPVVAGRIVRVWDGADRDGRRVPVGMYFVHVRTTESEASQRVVVVK